MKRRDYKSKGSSNNEQVVEVAAAVEDGGERMELVNAEG
jgi:hypothetical protein